MVPTMLQEEVSRRLRLGLPPELRYHDASHTLDDVVPAALLLADACCLPARGRRLLHAAALLHDLGFTRTRHEHEAAGAAMALELLPRHGFDAADSEAVARLILGTRPGAAPRSLAGRILVDADLDVLGRPDFWRRHLDLQAELASGGQPWDDEAWTLRQIDFLRRHAFLTEAGRLRGEAGKQQNLRRLERRRSRLQRRRAGGGTAPQRGDHP